MVQKPEIQYVDQFYSYGSTAVAPKKKLKERLIPREHRQRIHTISIDLVALAGMAAAVVLLAALVMGGIRLNTMWQEHDRMESYVSSLKLDNATLEHTYRTSYQLEEIEAKAAELGLVPETEVQTLYVRVQVPPKSHKWTHWENFRWFIEGLFE